MANNYRYTQNKSERTLRLGFIPLFTALTAVGAQISLPIGSVPITLQMLFVFLTGFLLEPIDAFVSMALYLVLGASGIPVFANFSAGLSHLVGPTAGYLWAFPISALLIANLRRKLGNIFAGFVGLSIVYFHGWLVLGMYLKNFSKAFLVGVVPFALIDAVKLALAIYAAQKIEKVLGGSVYGKA
ncbi:biotin transporter BioY [Fervidobacterium riparium]|uniref:Biotin transporter n=1 Tax=Fervidobacterium gondwanense DSM 13020 TaxID=1121883 RepID=A0A1M7S800_FERGO|nr:biotin transporter BioY [Fervidobacterium gondwanense]SHN54452.1 biotin transport system substrate-specific component [Fervidobacterium gondwanense DSM 13020]